MPRVKRHWKKSEFRLISKKPRNWKNSLYRRELGGRDRFKSEPIVKRLLHEIKYDLNQDQQEEVIFYLHDRTFICGDCCEGYWNCYKCRQTSIYNEPLCVWCSTDCGYLEQCANCSVVEGNPE